MTSIREQAIKSIQIVLGLAKEFLNEDLDTGGCVYVLEHGIPGQVLDIAINNGTPDLNNLQHDFPWEVNMFLLSDAEELASFLVNSQGDHPKVSHYINVTNDIISLCNDRIAWFQLFTDDDFANVFEEDIGRLEHLLENLLGQTH